MPGTLSQLLSAGAIFNLARPSCSTGRARAESFLLARPERSFLPLALMLFLADLRKLSKNTVHPCLIYPSLEENRNAQSTLSTSFYANRRIVFAIVCKVVAATRNFQEFFPFSGIRVKHFVVSSGRSWRITFLIE